MLNQKERLAPNEPQVRVGWTAHRGAPPETAALAEAYFGKLLPPDSFLMTDADPDILLFMSGGSERQAISVCASGEPVLLLSIEGNNAYAAATEVMAWMVNHDRLALLSDAREAAESGLLEQWRRSVGIWRALRGKKAGLVGSVSEWLVASDVPANILLQVFGVSLVTIPWPSLPGFRDQIPDDALMYRLQSHKASGLEDASRVLTLLREVIARNELDALAVECFSLVQQSRVTACLALAQLNSEGTVAACEGDLASMAGMMLLKAAAGKVPWMANTTAITANKLLLSHCTIGFDLVGDVKLATHYETNCSLAVKGWVEAEEVTLFRFSDALDRAFVAEGRIIGRPARQDACRTQIEIELPPQILALLKTRPLGNHLLLIPGNQASLLKLACRYKGIKMAELPGV